MINNINKTILEEFEKFHNEVNEDHLRKYNGMKYPVDFDSNIIYENINEIEIKPIMKIRKKKSLGRKATNKNGLF
jgi:hypothetical protein